MSAFCRSIVAALALTGSAIDAPLLKAEKNKNVAGSPNDPANGRACDDFRRRA